MIQCGCGKVLDKIPSWLSTVNVEFVCNNCPNRQTKNIAFMSLEPTVLSAKTSPDLDVEELPDEEAAEETAEEPA
jgi:hypothetical protein